MLLSEYVIHILQSCIEEEEEEDNVGSLKEILPDDQSPVQPDHEPHHPPDCPPAQERESLSADPPRVMLRCKGQSPGATAGSSVVVRVPGFLVDTVTGNKVCTPWPGLPSTGVLREVRTQGARKPTCCA